MIRNLPNEHFRITAVMEEYERYLNLYDRRLYLLSVIESSDDETGGIGISTAGQIVDDIFDYNRQDRDLPVEKRSPIRLYINSPGGDIGEGFAIVSAIEASKTPVYTINIGQWSSMAFLIGITGHRRFSLPHMTFLMHEGSNFVFGTANKAQDKMKFDERYENEVIKAHVIKHSNMKEDEYDSLARVEHYMLPEDALKSGFIDEIVTDIDRIL